MTSPSSPSTGITQPQPRRFGGGGSGAGPSTNGLRSPPRSTSNTPRSSTPTLVPPPVEPRRSRSSSSASLVSQDGSDAHNNSFGKAQAWLSTWAPRGEGRTREFLAHTVNGVASVASTVSGTVTNTLEQRAGLGNRPNSFHTIQDPQLQAQAQTQAQAQAQAQSPGTVAPSGLRSVVSPPGPTHTASTPTVPASQMARRPLQPANASRLAAPTPSTSPPLGNAHRPSLSMSNTSPPTTSAGPSTTQTTVNASASAGRSNSTSTPTAMSTHGPSHLNPNQTQHRSSFSFTHTRSPSVGQPPHAASPTPSRSSSTANGNGIWKGAGMPYKVGFQPAGVKSDRTAEFRSDRKRMAEEREKEEGRLGRRWAKLVDLHFNPKSAVPLPGLPRTTSTSSNLTVNEKRRSILSIDGALDAMKAKDMWHGLKGVAKPPDQLEAARKRGKSALLVSVICRRILVADQFTAAEQAIVKWEDDAEVRKCRICQSGFSLSNRKHHCRVCGRIVCSLPPTPSTLLAVQIQLFSPADGALPPGTRRDKCSLLLVADWKTGRGEEVEEGFVGWMKLDEGQTKGKGKAPAAEVPEVQVRGVRACRECWATVSRKQKIADRQRVTGFARLYQAIRSLQHEIEDIMPEFEEQMEALLSTEEPEDAPDDLVQTHKTLLALFAQYEHLSKRVSGMPCDEGGNQATVQSAVARSAATFLTKEMIKVQALPRYQKRLAEAKRDHMTVLQTTLADQLRIQGLEDDAAEDVALMLQPLLEQEAQLESYIADANAQRKYEDGKALSEALGEIRAEIAKITTRVK